MRYKHAGVNKRRITKTCKLLPRRSSLRSSLFKILRERGVFNVKKTHGKKSNAEQMLTCSASIFLNILSAPRSDVHTQINSSSLPR